MSLTICILIILLLYGFRKYCRSAIRRNALRKGGEMLRKCATRTTLNTIS